MIVLDTNVISEAMKPEPHPAVRAWLNDQAAETLYLSSVTLAELLFGIAARLILAFTPLWLDVATIVAVPFALLVLHFVGRRPRN